MGDLHLSADSTELFIPRAGLDSRVTQLGRTLRRAVLFLVYWLYLGCFVGLGQRIVIWPAILLVPRRRTAIVRAWLKLNARITLGLARSIANVRVTMQGPRPAESCVVVMNHQSLLDIPIAIEAVVGPHHPGTRPQHRERPRNHAGPPPRGKLRRGDESPVAAGHPHRDRGRRRP